MDKILSIFLFIRARLDEPSTHASLAAVFALTGNRLDEGMLQDIMNVAALGFGVLGFFVKEVKPLTVV